MHRALSRRPSPALAIAFLALLVSLGGTSYAVTALPAKSVGTKQLKNRAVTAPKIKNGAVTAAKLANGAVAGTQIADGSITGADVNEATLAKVPAAATADRATSAGTADRATVATRIASADVNVKTVTIPPNTISFVSADCDQGLKSVSGGAVVDDPVTEYVVDQFPLNQNTWAARVANTSGTTAQDATMIVICTAVDAITPPTVAAAAAARHQGARAVRRLR